MGERRNADVLGAELARWVTGLDHTDQVVWALLRFEDVLLGDRLSDVHLRLKLLRRQLAPRITVSQVLAVDALIDDEVWKDPDADLAAFRDAYQTARTWRRRDPIPAVWLEPPMSRNAVDPRGSAAMVVKRMVSAGEEGSSVRSGSDPATAGPNRG
ncbi:MAG: hypothetical protein IT227_04865 [Flavobacteriales bacterium]|nr:hypothetical protein [Flavobacteriales bacterium]